MVNLISLPSHVLVDITSYLDLKTLKALSPLHSILWEVCDKHIFRKISLPLSNPYFHSTPLKPALSTALEGLGWKGDIHQTGHLEASLRFITPLLANRAGWVQEISIDLKHRYHDPELDLDDLAMNPNLVRTLPMTPEGKFIDQSELDILRLQASLLRQRESPAHLPHLAQIFSRLPRLPAVKKVRLMIYESFPGYLPHLIPLFPNLTELVLNPHQLLVESPLTFQSFDCVVPKLKKLRVEPMLDSLRSLVGMLVQGGMVEELVLVDGRWTMNDELARAIGQCGTLKRVEVGRRARKVLLASPRVWNDGILV